MIPRIKKYLTKENVYFMFLFFFSISIPFSNHIANDFMTLSLLVWIFATKKRFEKDWLVYSMGFLTVSFIVSGLVNLGHIPTEFVKKPSAVFQEIFSLVTPFIWFLIVRSTSISRKKIALLITSFSASVFLAILIQLIFHPQQYSPVGNRFNFYYNPNFTAGLIALSCIVLIWMVLNYKNLYIRSLLGIMAIVNMVGIYFTFCRGAWLGLFVSLFLLFSFQLNKRFIFVTTVILLVLGTSIFFITKLTMPQEVSDTVMHNSKDHDISNGRSEIWNTSLKIARISPMFGVGPKMFKSYYAKTSPLASIPDQPIHIHAHNNFLQILVETGIVGLILFLLLDILLFCRAFRLLKESEGQITQRALTMILLGWLILWNVHGLFDYTFGLKYYTVPVLFLFGLLLSEHTPTKSSGSLTIESNPAATKA